MYACFTFYSVLKLAAEHTLWYKVLQTPFFPKRSQNINAGKNILLVLTSTQFHDLDISTTLNTQKNQTNK